MHSKMSPKRVPHPTHPLLANQTSSFLTNTTDLFSVPFHTNFDDVKFNCSQKLIKLWQLYRKVSGWSMPGQVAGGDQSNGRRPSSSQYLPTFGTSPAAASTSPTTAKSYAITTTAMNCSDSSGSGNVQSGQNTTKTSRACCFCWCCCCSCSCLTVQPPQPSSPRIHSQPSRSIGPKSITNIEMNEYRPSKNELLEWSQSFDCLMGAKAGQRVFAEFLKSEFSDENILFWQACDELKQESSSEKIEEKARIIYEDFISILSPKEVSLDSRVREIINNNMLNPSLETFDEAQAQIYTLMQRDSYPRFLNSQFYKNMVRETQAPSEVIDS